jgi:DNA repair protein RecO (recombination protein O)
LLLARGRSLDVFTQAETVDAYRAVREDLERAAQAVYVAELVDRFTAEHAPQEGLYALLLAVMEVLELGAPLYAVRYFELHLLGLAGYELQLSACALCDGRLAEEETLLAPAAGGFVCRDCRAAAGAGRLLSVRAMKVLRFARAASIDDFAGLSVGDEVQRELKAALADVIRHVLEREPSAGRFIEEVARLPVSPAPSPPAAVE